MIDCLFVLLFVSLLEMDGGVVVELSFDFFKSLRMMIWESFTDTHAWVSSLGILTHNLNLSVSFFKRRKSFVLYI